MADAAAPQNSISTGTSVRMSVKVKYVLWRVLKDAAQDLQKQQQAMKRAMRKSKTRRDREGAKEQEVEGKMRMCLYSSASRYNPTGILSRPTLTTVCE